MSRVKAYSYIRFSTTEQLKGDSLRRQTEQSEKYSAENDLDLDTSLNLKDLGKSAYHGDNAVTGKLRAFLDAVDTGYVTKGSYLLVENLDRLSRNKLPDALELFLSILRKGIVIVTLSDERKYVHDGLSPTDMMLSILSMSTAHEESLKKSHRLKESWKNKINNAQKIPITKWIPSWLSYNAAGKIVVVPSRVKVVKKIYELALKGYGTRLILKEIDAMGIAPWGFSPTVNCKKRVPKKWYISTISRILTERAVLGEYIPRKSKGAFETIKNYYPRIISDEEFYAVARLRSEKKISKSSGRKGDNVCNIFSGILKCGYSSSKTLYKCAGNNASVGIVNKGPRSKVKYLQCSRIKEGNIGCSECKKYWRYDNFEELFFEHMKNIDFSVVFGSEDEAANEISILKAMIVEHEEKINVLEKNENKYLLLIESESGEISSIVKRLKSIQGEKTDLEKKVKEIHFELQSKVAITKTRSEKEKEFDKLLKKSDLSNLDYDQRIRISEIIRKNIDNIYIFSAGLGGPNSAEIFEFDLMKDMNKQDRKIVQDFIEAEPAVDGQSFVVHYKTGEVRIVSRFSGSQVDSEYLMVFSEDKKKYFTSNFKERIEKLKKQSSKPDQYPAPPSSI